jgi:signal transduction histidine kinase
VEDLRRKLEDITAMKEEIEEAHHLLAIGREEERKRLAWEIHDIPLQKSIVILYGLQRCQRMAGSSLLKKLKELEGRVLSLSHELRGIC